MKNYLSFINENVSFFSIGEEVTVDGIVDGREFKEQQGTVGDICRTSISVNMNENGKCPTYTYRGQCYYIREFDWWVSPFNIFPPKIKKIIDDNTDPYGEENWGDIEVEEEITESNNNDVELLVPLDHKKRNIGDLPSIYLLMDMKMNEEKRFYIEGLFNKISGKMVYFYNHKNGKNLLKKRICLGAYWLDGDDADDIKINGWSLRLIGTKKDYSVNPTRPIGYYMSKHSKRISDIRYSQGGIILNEPKEKIAWFSHGKLEDWE